MDIGRELQAARQQAGLSIADLAQRTKIQPHKLQALEENAFDQLPEGVYLDGIVRVYAAEVGLDPDVLVSRVRQEAAQAAPVQLVHDIDTIEHVRPGNRVIPAHVPTAAVLRAAADLPKRRWIGLAMVFLAVIIGIGLSAYVVGTPGRSSSRPNSESAATSDKESPGPADHATATRADAPSDPRKAQAETPTAREEARRASTASVPVSGDWWLSTQVESSSAERFSGLRLGYKIELRQNGNRVSGTGKKVTENGARIPAAAQTPISVEGTILDDRLNLNFVERGARRESVGQFDLQIDAGGVLRGRFTSDAARSNGTVEARRLP
jgi:cytoskeletal protein RodZ